MTTVAGIHLGPDTHANRPAATSPTAGSLYYCSDHDLIYITDGSTWTTWADNSGGGGGSTVPDWMADLATPNSAGTDDQEMTGSIGGTAVTPTGTATWAQADGVLGCTFTGQSSNDICPRLYSITSPSAAMTAEISIPTFITRRTANPMVGVCFADGTAASSNAVALTAYAGTGGYIIATLAGTITNMTVTNRVTDVGYNDPSWWRMKLIWTASNTFGWAISGPAGPFTDFSNSTFSATITPTHFGPFVTSWGQSFASVVAIDYARLRSGDETV